MSQSAASGRTGVTTPLMYPATTIAFEPEIGELHILSDFRSDPVAQEHDAAGVVALAIERNNVSRKALDALAAFLKAASEIRSLDDLSDGERCILLEDTLALDPGTQGLPYKHLRGEVIESRSLIALLLEHGAKLTRESVATEAELAQRDIVQRTLARGHAQVRFAKKLINQRG